MVLLIVQILHLSMSFSFTGHLIFDSNLDKGVKDNHVVSSVQYFHLIKIEESTMWFSKEWTFFVHKSFANVHFLRQHLRNAHLSKHISTNMWGLF